MNLLAYLLIVAATMSPAELYKNLQNLQQLSAEHPRQALELYKTIRPDIPTEPSKGVFEIHRAGLEAAVRASDVAMIRDIATLFYSAPDWNTYLNHEKALLVSYVAIYNRRNAHFDKALDLYQCALGYAKDKSKSSLQNNIAVVYRVSGQLAKAEHLLSETIEQESRPEVIAALANNLANVYSDQQSYDKALTFYRQAFSHYQQVGNDWEAAYVGLNLLHVTIMAKQWSEFERYLITVKAQLKAVEDELALDVLRWQVVTYESSAKQQALSDKQRQLLIGSLPAVLQSEFKTNISPYAALLADKQLQSRVLIELQQLEQAAEQVTAEELPEIDVQIWCD
ncbi:tetratricopeptide repeat protein [Pseudoalteromonas sp. T1lg65]|uniref:tetratricopeptide repeat protein n=1 Tax=Pseudoalteromonas sp. T1lg65 TaxID=2077101 RepID=UPI003F7B04A6